MGVSGDYRAVIRWTGSCLRRHGTRNREWAAWFVAATWALLMVVGLAATAGSADAGPCAVHPNSPVLRTGAKGEWDAGVLGAMTVLKVEDRFHLYYEAWGVRGNSAMDYSTIQIGHATSSDGVHWTKDPANPVVPKGSGDDWDRDGTWDPFVLHEDGLFKMWYGGGMGGRCDWGYAVSTDGEPKTVIAIPPVITPQNLRREMSVMIVSLFFYSDMGGRALAGRLPVITLMNWISRSSKGVPSPRRMSWCHSLGSGAPLGDPHGK